MASELDSKSLLAREICSISTIFASCLHRGRSPGRSVFVDWYLILRVDGGSAGDVIRRRYRQLALQLHPDKNSHPKAEVAFKLISEAYSCLADRAGRRAFDAERQKSFCKECHRKSISAHSTSERLNADNTEGEEGNTRSKRKTQAFKEARIKFKEECKIIENCLQANERSLKDFPLFDPADYKLYPNYPHYRDWLLKNQHHFWYFHASEVQRCMRRGSTCESPVYQMKSTKRSSRTQNPG